MYFHSKTQEINQSEEPKEEKETETNLYHATQGIKAPFQPVFRGPSSTQGMGANLQIIPELHGQIRRVLERGAGRVEHAHQQSCTTSHQATPGKLPGT